ncbi:MAG: dienelactone hydrolase family protein [Alphaproteobacteria bacterium]
MALVPSVLRAAAALAVAGALLLAACTAPPASETTAPQSAATGTTAPPQPASDPLAFTTSTVGPPRSNARGELYEPKGTGPFPAVVVLHGCSGVSAHTRAWGERLASWGYVALVVDSFRPRGQANVCGRGRDIPPSSRAADAFGAAAYLRMLPTVRPDAIGLIGFSHGGWTTLHAVLADAGKADRAEPFRAAVAYYPYCEMPTAPLATDTLILIGDADDWTPSTRCERWRDTIKTSGHALEMTIYPGALHAFDSALPTRVYYGHKLGHDPAAAADSIDKTRAFLAARLAPP